MAAKPSAIFLQGYVAIRISWRPLLTPPYLLIVFAITQSLLALLSLGHDLSSSGVGATAILDVIAICGPATFAYIAGTLPITPYMPALNVAVPGEVRRRLPHVVPRH